MPAPEKVIQAVRQIESGMSKHLPGTVVVTGRSGKAKTLAWNDPRTLTRAGSSEWGTFAMPEHDWNLPKLRKRTWQERVESLTNRLVDSRSQTGILDATVMEQLTSEYWKAGKPVTREQIEQVAISILQREDRKQGLSFVHHVGQPGVVSPPKKRSGKQERSGF